MAEPSTDETQELSLESHLQFAVRAIEENIHLRQLVRHFLALTQVLPASSVFDLDPRQNAYNQGYQAAGLAFADILTSVAPRIVPTLTLEELTNE